MVLTFTILLYLRCMLTPSGTMCRTPTQFIGREKFNKQVNDHRHGFQANTFSIFRRDGLRNKFAKFGTKHFLVSHIISMVLMINLITIVTLVF